MNNSAQALAAKQALANGFRKRVLRSQSCQVCFTESTLRS